MSIATITPGKSFMTSKVSTSTLYSKDLKKSNYGKADLTCISQFGKPKPDKNLLQNFGEQSIKNDSRSSLSYGITSRKNIDDDNESSSYQRKTNASDFQVENRTSLVPNMLSTRDIQKLPGYNSDCQTVSQSSFALNVFSMGTEHNAYYQTGLPMINKSGVSGTYSKMIGQCVNKSKYKYENALHQKQTNQANENCDTRNPNQENRNSINESQLAQKEAKKKKTSHILKFTRSCDAITMSDPYMDEINGEIIKDYLECVHFSLQQKTENDIMKITDAIKDHFLLYSFNNSQM